MHVQGGVCAYMHQCGMEIREKSVFISEGVTCICYRDLNVCPYWRGVPISESAWILSVVET